MNRKKKNAAQQRQTSREDFVSGISRFCTGLGKKVLIANLAGDFATQYLDSDLAALSTAGAWFGILMFSIQIYFDFSGYSLMALGLGRMLGFEFPKNFKHPYISRSVSEFWRRWHITLGRWFREYVYIPLGGNRKGKARTIFNLFVVWSLTAVWHGAEGHFLIWGASLLLLLALEKAFLLQFLKKSEILSHVYLVLVVPLTWMAFAIADVGQLGVYYARMFPFFGVGETVRQMDFLQ